jgi:ABC-type arginine transport system ATPase subunit
MQSPERGSNSKKIIMTEQEIGDISTQVTAWADLTVLSNLIHEHNSYPKMSVTWFLTCS